MIVMASAFNFLHCFDTIYLATRMTIGMISTYAIMLIHTYVINAMNKENWEEIKLTNCSWCGSG